jgi:LysR family transcriptional regulator for bpeEF and oprC
MDRLRSLQYFIACADEGSLSGAARRLEVTVPAVAKLLGALEKRLGISLFERSAQGLALTAAGEAYLESCRPAVATLDELDEQVRASGTRARGTIGVGVQQAAGDALLRPFLARFHQLHPDVRVELRDATQMVGAEAPGIDVYLSFSWPRNPDMVHRAIYQPRFEVVATAEYWAAHGKPSHPRDLASHDCILMRTQTGTLLDVWSFERDGKVEEVTVGGWLACSNSHRSLGVAMAVAGQGVARMLQWLPTESLKSMGLVPVLTDWASREAPPLHLSYRPSSRRLARVRAFIDFMQEAGREAGAPRGRVPVPRWAGTRIGRASSIPSTGRKR